MRHFISCLFLTVVLTAPLTLHCQITRNVLFLGNSYTGFNNLPQLVHDVALSAGDTLLFDSYTPGGYQLASHNSDSTSINKIMAGGWQYVVLQGQSQEPITQSGVFMYGGIQLNNLIAQHNPCAVTMLYNTWGRKNGDATNCATFPVMCTYEGMDSTLRNKYIELATFIRGEISPVSFVWKYLRQNHPSIDLYQTDESHPSAAGSYAAACCFYAALFKKDPTLITFDFGLPATDAAIIRGAAKTQVFDVLNTWDFKLPPQSAFNYIRGAGVNEINFSSNTNGTAETYLWDFGDGNTSTDPNPTHFYAANGSYNVSLTTTNCNLQGLFTSVTDTVIEFCSHTPTVFAPQPWLCSYDTLFTQPASAYQWFLSGVPIPETGQYIADYSQYGISGFSVMSTVGGCSELSEIFTGAPQWSGYYFDLVAPGNPCLGDTIPWVVLNVNGVLPVTANILWYKNDTLLTAMTNEDTLFISSGGVYTCKVIDPATLCPLDTTSYTYEFNCSGVGVDNNQKNLQWNVFPNPATESITIKFSNPAIKDFVQVYSAMGQLIKQVEAAAKTEIDIAGLPTGVYFIKLKNSSHQPLKIMKR
jgi:PKD repeat protein